jgi:2-desacetyl-2-hydroxyethyl bacteriochlorophyllide A dehydrogenase
VLAIKEDTVPVQTQAVVIVEPWRIELRTVTIPDPEPQEVLARTLVSGISVGTERHYITGAYAEMGKDVAANFPFATGYQRCAVIERVGSDVEDLVPGDRVLMGRSRFTDPGLKGIGGHVGYGVFDARLAYKLPADADEEEAALWVMAGVGLHGARMSRIEAGETVAVISLGMIGQMAAQAARLRGARVLASDRCRHRVELAGAHSADDVFEGDPEAFATHVLAAHPHGVDVVADTGSKVAIWDTCLRMVRREGRINLQGYYPGAFTIDSYNAHVHRATAICPSGYDDPNEIARHLSGKHRFAIKPLITHRFPAAEAAAAYDVVIRAPQDIVGGIIDWR